VHRWTGGYGFGLFPNARRFFSCILLSLLLYYIRTMVEKKVVAFASSNKLLSEFELEENIVSSCMN
jgi:hypothetical protein